MFVYQSESINLVGNNLTDNLVVGMGASFAIQIALGYWRVLYNTTLRIDIASCIRFL